MRLRAERRACWQLQGQPAQRQPLATASTGAGFGQAFDASWEARGLLNSNEVG